MTTAPPDPKRGDPTLIPTGEFVVYEKVWWWNGRQWYLTTQPTKREFWKGEAMERIETIKVESDEEGWELHVTTDEGEYRFNMHAVAEDHYFDVQKTIGSWLAEGYAARDEQERAERDRWAREDAEDEGPWPGESPMDYFNRTGNDGPLREMGDAHRTRAKEEA